MLKTKSPILAIFSFLSNLDPIICANVYFSLNELKKDTAKADTKCCCFVNCYHQHIFPRKLYLLSSRNSRRVFSPPKLLV